MLVQESCAERVSPNLLSESHARFPFYYLCAVTISLRWTAFGPRTWRAKISCKTCPGSKMLFGDYEGLFRKLVAFFLCAARLGEVFWWDSYPLCRGVPFVQGCPFSHLNPWGKVCPLVWSEYLDHWEPLKNGEMITCPLFSFLLLSNGRFPKLTSVVPETMQAAAHYRVAQHLVDLHLVYIKVGSCCYPTGQRGSYSTSPPAGRTFHKCVKKRWSTRCLVTV